MYLTVDQVNSRLRGVKGFVGTYNINSLPKELHDGYYVILMIKPGQSDGHFVLFHKDSGGITYIDPYGLKPPRKLTDWWTSNGINQSYFSPITIQGVEKSTDCGLFCIFIIKHLAKGETFEQVLTYFNTRASKLESNDKVVERTYKDKLESCIMKVKAKGKSNPYAICKSSVKKTGGNILTEPVKRVIGFLSGPRTTLPPPVKKFINEYGSWVITKIEIHREPIDKNIKKVVDLISSGGFSENQKKLGYDDVFHLYMKIILRGPQGQQKCLLLEKNQVIQIKGCNVFDQRKGEMINVPLHMDNLTFAQFIDGGIKQVGEKHFVTYNNVWNCQDFIYTLLIGSALANAENIKFVKQDAAKLFAGLPITKGISNVVTNLAARFDRLLYGGNKK